MASTTLNLKEKKETAQKIAYHCQEILEQEFPVTEVVIFGSVRGDSIWHEHSDIDIGVKGLSEQQLSDAYGRLEEILPPWLKLDLIPLENAPAYLARSIYHPEKMSSQYQLLQAQLEDEFKALDQNFEALEQLLGQQKTIPEIALIPALASYIADFYTGCERMAERVAVALDGGLPKQENWHQLLLRQMAETGGETRPPLWQGSLLLELDELRKFRHLARHRYNVHLKSDRTLSLAQQIPSIYEKVKEAVNLFISWLKSQEE